MRVWIAGGSPHPNGPTAALTAAFTAALPPHTETVADCYRLMPAPCLDCGACREKPGCVRHDLDAVYAALEQADLLVFASPIHNRSFSAPLKTLIDRLQPYWAARFVRGERLARPKQAVLLTTGEGDPERDDAAVVRQQLLPALTVLNAAFAGQIHAVVSGGVCGMADIDRAAQLARNIREELTDV